MSGLLPGPPLETVLARASDIGDVLPHLHERALQRVGGVCSLLFEYDPRNGWLLLTSASRATPHAGAAWTPAEEERLVIDEAFRQHAPTYVPALQRQMPDLWARIETTSALLLPLSRGVDRTGLLIVGFDDVPPPLSANAEVIDLANAFQTTIELFRLRRNQTIRENVRQLLDEFCDGLSATSDIRAGLETFCRRANSLFRADRTSIWIHDRHARNLVMRFSSDPARLAPAAWVASDDAVAPAATAMRRRRADMAPGNDEGRRSIAVPLRGYRRALGALLIDGVAVEPGGELDALDRADELARQLSSTIETAQLIDGIAAVRAERGRRAQAPSPPEAREGSDQSARLAALGQLVAGIAHELNNPLQGVLGHLQLLRATRAWPKPLRREMRTICREADRAADIVRNLLVFAGSEGLLRRSVSMNTLLRKVAALRQRHCRARQIEIACDLALPLPRVEGDPLLLHQALFNIVMNAEQAIDSSRRPGRIVLATRFDASTDRIVASVRDSGPGIREDALAHIFEPFYTTKDIGQGTGLGLSLAYGIVREHGGTIAAANHPEGGAVCTIELPALRRRHD
jgi:signal transduction histidine kinase